MEKRLIDSELPHLALTAAHTNAVCHFRGDLIRACIAAGCKVTVLAAATSPERQEKIENLGADFKPLHIQRNSISITNDWRTLSELKSAYAALRPSKILAYTIKPIIWGGIAARKSDAEFYALITGLGFAFHGDSLKRKMLTLLVSKLYKFALSRARGVIFQNRDNRDLFVERGIVPADKCHVVGGSGVNVAKYARSPLPEGAPHFLLVARLLGEKGIREYLRAAERVKQQYPDAIFSLIGRPDPSPDGILVDEIQSWQDKGVVVYHGETKNVIPFLDKCHVYCLPSYHEGMPRTVLEAMSVGRPILTTLATGCRDTVEPGVNGKLVPCGDDLALADAMKWFLENRDRWQVMADHSRRMAEEKFDVHRVNEDMLEILGVNRRCDESEQV